MFTLKEQEIIRLPEKQMQRNGNRPLDLIMHLNLQLLTASSRDSFIYFVSCQIGFSFFPLIMHSKISCRCIKSISALACNTNPLDILCKDPPGGLSGVRHSRVYLCYFCLCQALC